MSSVIYLTGYPGSGKLTIANHLAKTALPNAVVLDSHTLSNIVYRRCNKNIVSTEDDFSDCRSLAKKMGPNQESAEQLFRSLSQYATDARSLPDVRISEGQQPHEIHYQLIEKVRSAVLNVVKLQPNRDFIFTNKLYANHKFHDDLIEQISSLCGEGQNFYGFRLEATEEELIKRVVSSDRQTNGKLMDIEKLREEITHNKLTNSPLFESIDASKGSHTAAFSIISSINSRQQSIKTKIT